MIRRNVFKEIGGFDENLKVAFGDIDLCLRIRKKGYRIVYTPYAKLYHHECATRGDLHPKQDEDYMINRWKDVLIKGDPYYNPNLTLIREDFSIASHGSNIRPLAALFDIYNLRTDLQKAYPEVKEDNHQKLIDWTVINGVTIDGTRHLIRPYYSWYVKNASQKVKPLGTLFNLYNLDGKLQKLFPEVLNGEYKRIIEWASKINQEDCKNNPELKKLLPYLPWYDNNKSKTPVII
jgi:hypothetical protein